MDLGRDDRSVAVVGVGCRLPGGIADLDGLWAALRDGRDLVGVMPPDRFPKDRFVDPGTVRPGRSYTAAGGFLDDIASFDAAYFGISPGKPRTSIRSSGCCWRWRPRRWTTPAVPAERCAGSDTCVFVGSLRSRLRHRPADTGRPHQRRTPCPAPPCPSRRTASPTPSTCAARAWRSTRPAPRRWWQCTAPAAPCATGASRVALAGGVNVLLVPVVVRRVLRRGDAVAGAAGARPSPPTPTATSAPRAAACSC